MSNIKKDKFKSSKNKSMNMIDSFEKIKCLITADVEDVSKYVANEIANLIRLKESNNEKILLS